ncbi:MAG: response regulator [Candidatus Omnitrophica bacterium]|nr:response regulator [Candidatus Omnitrophota bacterium]
MRSKSQVLLVEDDGIDMETIKRAFKEVGIPNRLDVATNGEEALDYLRGTDQNPSIILLDLNMPRMNGAEFLKVMKQDHSLKHIPVVVLTSSKQKQDIFEMFGLGAAGYMVKPLTRPEFAELFKVIGRYWSTSELPE